MQVRFPILRGVVIRAVRRLADPQYQRRVWLSPHSPDEYTDSLEATVDTLFDVGEVYPTPPYDSVGLILATAGEVRSLYLLGERLSRMCDRLYGAADSEFLNDPGWADVITLARGAAALFEDEHIGGAPPDYRGTWEDFELDGYDLDEVRGPPPPSE